MVAEGRKSVKGISSSKKVKDAHFNFLPKRRNTNKAEKGALRTSESSIYFSFSNLELKELSLESNIARTINSMPFRIRPNDFST